MNGKNNRVRSALYFFENFNKQYFILIICFLLSSSLFINSAESSGTGPGDVVGYGGRAPGMAGSFVGVADDASAAYYNPAGLAQIEGHRIEMGNAYMNSSLHASGYGLEEEGVHIPEIGLVFDFRKMVPMERKAALGLVVAVPDKWKSAYRIRLGKVYDPYDPVYGADNHLQRRITLAGGVGIELLPWLLVGGGVNFMVGATSADVRLDTDLYGHINERTSGLGLDVQTDIGYLAGLLLKPTDRLRLGFAWRKDLRLQIMYGLKADARATLEGGAILIPINLQIPINDVYNPEQFAFGTSYYLKDDLLFSFDMTCYVWDDFMLPEDIAPAVEFKNVWVPRLGAEWEPREGLKLRCGYSFQESPVKQQPQGFYKNLVDSDKHIFALGIGYDWHALDRWLKKPLEINAFWQYHYIASKSFEDVHGTGRTWDVGGNNIAAGLTFTLKM